MDKGTFNIHMVNQPSKTRSKGKNQPNRVHLGNMGKCLYVFNAFLLRKSFHDQTRFVILNNTIRGEFGSIYPSTLNNILFV